MLLTFKTKLKLTSDQRATLDSMSNEARLLYNHYLSQLKDQINGAINIYKQVRGDYNPSFETLAVSERFGWCQVNQMNKNQ